MNGPRTPEPIIIGIDNGLSGGMVALDRAGSVLRMATMPEMVGVSEIDSRRVIEWIRSVVGMERAVCGIEVCPDHAKKKSTMRSMGISHGILIGSIHAACRAVRIVRVVSGTKPKASWQRRLFGYVPEAGQTKTLAAAMARRIWPDQDWIPNGCRTPNTGLIDAALIAHFVRTENL